MKNHEELIKNFRIRMTKLAFKEYVRKGSIQSRATVLLLDTDEDAVFTHVDTRPIMHLEGLDFLAGTEKKQDVISRLIRSARGDGYEILATFHVEYSEDADGEKVFCSIAIGESLEQWEIRIYGITRDPASVMPDGSILFAKPVFKLSFKG